MPTAIEPDASIEVFLCGFFAAAFFTAAFFIGGFIHWLFPGLAPFQVATDLLCLDAVHFFPQALGASEHYVPHGPFYFTKRSHQMCENLSGSFRPAAILSLIHI